MTNDDPQGSAVPDVYVDQMTLALSSWGITLSFARSPSSPNPVRPQAGDPQVVVRMSLEHAKAMVMAVRKTLKQYELESLGDPIKIPRAQLSAMNLDETDW